MGSPFTYDFSQVWEEEERFTVVSSNPSVVPITKLATFGSYRAKAFAG